MVLFYQFFCCSSRFAFEYSIYLPGTSPDFLKWGHFPFASCSHLLHLMPLKVGMLRSRSSEWSSDCVVPAADKVMGQISIPLPLIPGSFDDASASHMFNSSAWTMGSWITSQDSQELSPAYVHVEELVKLAACLSTPLIILKRRSGYQTILKLNVRNSVSIFRITGN